MSSSLSHHVEKSESSVRQGFPLEVLHVTKLSVWRAGAAYFDPARTHDSAYLSLLDRCSWSAIYV